MVSFNDDVRRNDVQVRPTVDNGGDPDTEKLIAEIVEIWHSYEYQGLEVRHRIGARLNAELGVPGTRQAYGRHVVNDVAARLGKDPSEISRMRRFADVFGDFEAFKSLHPTVQTWTDVKPLLVTKPAVASTEPPGAASEAKPGETPLGLTTAALRRTASAIRKLTVEPDSRDAKRLCAAVQRILDAAQAVVGVRWMRVAESAVVDQASADKADIVRAEESARGLSLSLVGG